MTLHVVYRSHAGENLKDRPPWYSKDVALLSFCRSVEQVGTAIEVVFLNDGPIPAARAELMASIGELVTIKAGTNRRSYLRALRLPAQRRWAADDVVLFAEDDYLWRPDAVSMIAKAGADAIADYLAPYASSESGRVDGVVDWRRHLSTTSTFAVRVGVLRQDARLLLLCCLSGGDFDHTSSLTVQGIAKFRLVDLVRHHPGPEGSGALRSALRAAHLTAMRSAVDLRSLRRPSRRRNLLAAEPPLATHMETPWLAPGDWERLAHRTWHWSRHRAPAPLSYTPTPALPLESGSECDISDTEPELKG